MDSFLLGDSGFPWQDKNTTSTICTYDFKCSKSHQTNPTNRRQAAYIKDKNDGHTSTYKEQEDRKQPMKSDSIPSDRKRRSFYTMKNTLFTTESVARVKRIATRIEERTRGRK